MLQTADDERVLLAPDVAVAEFVASTYHFDRVEVGEVSADLGAKSLSVTTATLVTAAVPFGIPLILHVVGLIPAFVQALVFTLLTSSFLASAIHRGEPRKKKKRAWSRRKAAPGDLRPAA